MEDHRITETDIWAYVLNNADKKTVERVELWIGSNHYDPYLYERIKNLHKITKEEAVGDSDIQKAKEKFFDSVGQEVSDRRRFIRKFMRYAAVLAVLSTSLMYFFYNNDSKVTIKTVYGEQKEIELPDGSKVWMNSSSQLSYQKSHPRNIYLEGEAFFEVMRDEQVPFTVETHDQIKIKVLGTSFNVKSYTQKTYTETVLLEGKVELSSLSSDEKIQMIPNDKITFLRNGKKLVQSKVDTPTSFVSWKEGILQFSDKPFREIATDLAIQHNIKIRFKNDKIANSKFTGSFEQETPIEEILETLQLTKSFNYHQSSYGNWVVE
ncbi:FecR family protein [Flagellimonas sp.]|uniref:FecR family protein n=1 Tax=Flagellimonas sp. TaxID=2058762 RepID=UPI003B5AF08E